jgi:hypothetical protein
VIEITRFENRAGLALSWKASVAKAAVGVPQVKQSQHLLSDGTGLPLASTTTETGPSPEQMTISKVPTPVFVPASDAMP